ncbi:hypothetical protein D3C85_1070870 [compost metagenome]
MPLAAGWRPVAAMHGGPACRWRSTAVSPGTAGGPAPCSPAGSPSAHCAAPRARQPGPRCWPSRLHRQAPHNPPAACRRDRPGPAPRPGPRWLAPAAAPRSRPVRCENHESSPDGRSAPGIPPPPRRRSGPGRPSGTGGHPGCRTGSARSVRRSAPGARDTPAPGRPGRSPVRHGCPGPPGSARHPAGTTTGPGSPRRSGCSRPWPGRPW